MTDTLTLSIQLLDYWHCGTGKGSGEFLDALVDRDSSGLPYVPGKMLKGLLREAVGCCEAWRHVADGSEVTLFGSRALESTGSREDRTDPVRQLNRATRPGVLRVTDARLPDELSRWLLLPDNPGPRQALFRDLFATAVNHATGSAVSRSLRGMEVAVPLALRAEIGPVPGRIPPDDWRETLQRALPLVRSVGHQRSRGLGRCVIEIAKEP